MEEIWTSAVGYEGFYEVSNLGRVRSVEHKDAINHVHPSKIIKQGTRPNGYKVVHLCMYGVATFRSVHMLVAMAFLERKEGCDVVNHIDNNPLNNCVSNLEWTTYKGNMQWSTKQGRMKYQPDNLKKAQESHYVPVIATDKYGNEYYFKSQTEATEKLGLKETQRGHIASACKKQRGYKTVGGYSWRYANEEKEIKR